VAVDESLLESLASLRDPALGVDERFLRLELRSGWTVGVLSNPLGPKRSFGWIVCHSFGSEHMHLNASEVTIARTLAASGFPVLRFHCQGYGDSEHAGSAPTPSIHVADTEDAIERFRDVTGVDQVGLIGARFGAAVATIVASRQRIPLLILIDPLIDGRRYVSDLLRSAEIAGLTDGQRRPTKTPSLREQLEAVGAVNIRGFLFTRAIVDELTALDLMRTEPNAAGALIVQISRGPEPRAAFSRLAQWFEARGASTVSSVVADPAAALFGDGHFRSMDEDRIGDTLTNVHRRLADLAEGWAIEQFAGGGPRGTERQEGNRR
jgi:pimeloyl-ACP methyl ester carboxylesterase